MQSSWNIEVEYLQDKFQIYLIQQFIIINNKNMKNYYKNLTAVLILLLINYSGFSQNFEEGIFILNEGMIGTETASVSYLGLDGTLENNVFSNQNSGMNLGDTAQGMGFTEESAYIVLNYSNEIKVVNRTNFELITSITDQMAYPRYIAFSGDKGYVTNWGDPGSSTDDYIAIIDLLTNTVTGTIPVAEGPEEILEKDGILYVAHQGGYGFGNSVSIIDVATNEVTSITVGEVPSALRIDNNFLYVLCSGNPFYAGTETSGKIVKIDLNDYQNTIEYTFPGLDHPEFLGLDATDLYYVLNRNIYKMPLTDTELPAQPFIITSSNNVLIPYGFNKIDDKLYLTDGIDYVSDGKVFVYNEDGSFETEYTVGPLPNGVYTYENPTALVQEFAGNNIALYPNPATDSFKLNINGNAEISIYDTSGRLVKVGIYNNEAVKVTDLKAGVYLVQIVYEGNIWTEKLIVKWE